MNSHERLPHTFDGKPVFKDSRGYASVKDECPGCGSEYFAKITNIIRGEKQCCSHDCGMARSKSHEDSESQYKGVSWQKASGKWQAKIMKDGEEHYLGIFESEEEAAKAYDKKAEELWDNPALNFS